MIDFLFESGRVLPAPNLVFLYNEHPVLALARSICPDSYLKGTRVFLDNVTGQRLIVSVEEELGRLSSLPINLVAQYGISFSCVCKIPKIAQLITETISLEQLHDLDSDNFKSLLIEQCSGHKGILVARHFEKLSSGSEAQGLISCST
jgi:hypothetical protein